jgi:hypothetical protein
MLRCEYGFVDREDVEMKRTLIAAAALAAGATLLAAGCGSSGSTTSTSAGSAVDWANSLCSATTTWKQALQDAAAGLKSEPSRSGLSAAAGKARSATEAYASALAGLGAPDTKAGDQAKAQIDTLRSQLQDGAAAMKDAAAGVSGASGVVEAVSVASTTLAQMGQEIDKALASLRSLEPKGELDQAIQQADSCAPYTA